MTGNRTESVQKRLKGIMQQRTDNQKRTLALAGLRHQLDILQSNTMKVSEGSQEGQSTARSVSRAHEDAVAVADPTLEATSESRISPISAAARATRKMEE